MSAPDVQDSTEFSYYVTREGIRHDYANRSAKDLAYDVTKAHDNIRKLVGEKDRMQRKLGEQWIWIKVLTAAVVGAWGLVLVLVGLLVEMMRS
jgi:hypothetical protein